MNTHTIPATTPYSDSLAIGESATDPVSLHGATPVAQRAGAVQAAVTLTTGAAVITTGSTTTAPYGFVTAAQADGLVARVNSLIADAIATTALLNELQAALVEKGIIKGSA